MQKTLIVALIAVATGVWFFLNQQTPTEPTSTSSISEVDPSIQKQAKAHIQQLTNNQTQAINIQSADNFVTSEQLLNIPQQKNNTAGIVPTDSSSASGSTFAIDPSRLKIPSTNQTSDSPQEINLSSDNVIKLNELLDNPDQAGKNIYFIHAVNQGDDKGLWGIIQHGLIRTFTEGLKLPGQEKKVFAEIPQEADERLANNNSSFLGKILQNKVKRTYIYNYQKGILGDDPNLIKPGQQLVIVTFSEQELIGIYNHFIN